MADNFNTGTQQLYMNNWNQQNMVPAVLMQSNDPQNPQNPLGIDAGRARLLASVQPQPKADPTANPITGIGGYTAESKSTFGTPNWDWINFSNTVQSGLSYAGNYFGNSRQNAVQDYNREKLSPLNYLPRTSNTSVQDQYGMSYYEDGGVYEDDDESFIFQDDDDTLVAPSDNKEPTKSKKQVRAEREAAEEALRSMDEMNASNFYQSLSFNNLNPPDDVDNPYQSAQSGFAGIFANEGANTGQPTNLNSSAIGRGQMIKGTREMMYKQMGITDIASAEKQFKSDPNFEMAVLNQYRGNLDKQISKEITGPQREYMIAKGWYTGNVNYPDNQVPHPEAGNKLTAAEYANRAIKKYDNGGTFLSADEELVYSKWKNKLPKNLQYEGDYDLKGLWKSNPNITPSKDLHFPDTYKLPNHSTFSNESIYYSGDQPNSGGYWNNDNQYVKNPFIGPPIPPTMERGGMVYKQDEEYNISPKELKRLKELGYTIEIL